MAGSLFKMRGDGRSRESGVLLADAMLAIALFGVALASWAGLTQMKMRAIGEAERRFVATSAAQSAIAEAREGLRAPGAFEVKGGAGLKGELRSLPRPDGLHDLVAEVRWREPGAPNVEESVVISTTGRP